jgi:hypothetical protein
MLCYVICLYVCYVMSFVFMQAILLISVLIACATAPVNMLVDFLFQDIISAPSADEYKVELQSRQIRQRFGRRISTVASHARGAIRNSISMARSGIAPVLGGSNSPSHGSKKRSLSARVSSNILQRFTVAEASTRQFPPSVVQSYASTSMILKGVFDHQESTSDTRTSVIVPTSMSRLLRTDIDSHDEASPYDSAERGQSETENLVSIDSFFSMLQEQCELLQGPARKDFEERWGLDADSYSAGNQPNPDVVPVQSRMSAKWKRSLCCSKQHNRNTRRKQIISSAIEKTTQVSNEKIHKLRIASDLQVGLEVMHLFIIDLLG